MAYVTWVTPATWDGKYPLPDLPAGKIWTGPYQNSAGTGYSCIGFARMVLDATYGRGSSLSKVSFSEVSPQDAFKNIKKGARVTFSRGGDQQHGLIVASKSSSGIKAYDCNVKDDNTISYYDLSWARMKEKYTGIIGGYNPSAR